MEHVTTESAEATLLVVDDEPNIRELLSASLKFSGFNVHTAADGQEALTEIDTVRPDLVVLDVMMPGLDGFAVMKRLRDRGNKVPVVFLTAKDDVSDRVSGLTLGADDYIIKPFSLEEVVARIRAVLRRAAETVANNDSRLSFADIELDDDSHEVRRGGQLIDLSPTEFNLLRYLMLNPGRVLSKSQILDHVWNYDFGGDAGIVESYISYLRKKIDAAGDSDQQLIHTKRGVGYVLKLPS